MIRRLIAIATSLVLLIMATGWTSAATDQAVSASGLKISPVRTVLTMTAGETKTVQIYVTNVSSASTNLQVIAYDFTAKNQSGTPSLLLNGEDKVHGLKQFIAPISNISLEPNQQLPVQVSISIPKGTLGGGYYAAVRFAAASNSSGHNVTLSAGVASLILVTLKGPGLNEQLSLSNFAVQKGGSSGHFFFGSTGLSAAVRFRNTGNVQEAPFGKVVVRSGSKTIQAQEINNAVSPSSVLPSSLREFDVPLKSLGLVGKYQVAGYFSYGSSNQILSSSTTIYVLSPWGVVLIVIALLLVILAIVIIIRLYKRAAYLKHQSIV